MLAVGTNLIVGLRLIFGAGELVRRRNQIFSSLLKTYEKLKKLGFIYYNRQVVFLEGKAEQSEQEIQKFERLGIQVFLCVGNHHRKLAILDRKTLWEGSLNILSQIHSRELMRRTNSKQSALEVFHFLKLDRVI